MSDKNKIKNKNALENIFRSMNQYQNMKELNIDL